MIRASFFVFSFSVLLLEPVGAEVRTLRGLPIAVDEIAAIDTKNTRITFEGRVFLVPNEEVESTILQQALQSNTAVQKLPPAALIEFTRNALAAGDQELTTRGIEAVLASKKMTLDRVKELLAGISASPALIAGLKNTVQNSVTWSALIPTLKAAVLVEVGIADSAWIQQSAVGAALAIRDEVHRYASSAFADAIKTRHFARLPLIASLLKDLFGVEDAQFQESRLISDQLIRFHQVLKSRDTNTLEINLVALKGNESLKTYIFPYLVDELHRAAREDVDQNNPVRALELLSLIDLSFRTPTTHTLLKLALARLPASQSSLLDRPVVKRFLLSMTQYDEDLKATLCERLEAQLRAAAREDNLSQADRALDTLIALRPDPDKANDALRIYYAEQLRALNHIPQSLVQLRNVRTGVPLLVRLRMLSEDVLGISLALLVTVLVSGSLFAALVVARLISIRRRQRKPVRSGGREDDEDTQEEAAEESPVVDDENYRGPVFRRMDSPKISPEKKEYLQCLTVFKLEPKASFKEIRQAYRTAVKEHHPDRNTDGVASDRFVNLNETYERILELRKLLGMGDD